jgi:hypothetical protein
MRRLRTAGIAAALALGALTVVPGLAGAQGVTIQAAKTACDGSISVRVTNLGTAQKDLDAGPGVDAATKATLDQQISAAISGLGTLKTIIDADATLVRVRADCRRIVTDYYVDALLLPKIQLVRASGKVGAAATTLKHLAGLLQARLDAARARNKDTTSAQGFVTDLGLKADAATKAVAGVPAAVLPLAPAGFPGNRATLVTARASVDTARGALKGAVAAAQNAINALKALG